MTTGTVLDLTAYVTSTLVSPNGRHMDVDLVIDTGFTGTVALPEALCLALELPYLTSQQFTFADGHVDWANIYVATLELNGRRIALEIPAMGDEALFGMT